MKFLHPIVGDIIDITEHDAQRMFSRLHPDYQCDFSSREDLLEAKARYKGTLLGLCAEVLLARCPEPVYPGTSPWAKAAQHYQYKTAVGS